MFIQRCTLLVIIAFAPFVAQKCEAGERRVTVPPVDELLVISPQVDPLNKPRPTFVNDGNGTQHLEIPPTIIVHQYYYSGDRCFQGPMLPGGPTVLVATHPKTGEQIQLQAQLRPGAPKIHYGPKEIRYEYSDQWIVLEFGCEPLTHPRIRVREKSHVVSATRKASQRVTSSSTTLIQRTGLKSTIVEADQASRNAIHASAEGFGNACKFVVNPTVQFLRSTPLSSLLTPSDGDVQSFGSRARSGGIVDGFENTVPTNR